MLTFKEVNNLRTKLKLELSNYRWYVNSSVELENNSYFILVMISCYYQEISKIAPIIVDNVSIKYEHFKGK